ncbi:MAG: DegT/DnrJ/EryC1/StrS aminotransferase family protein [Deltaproteobacteria bacterium]|nr:DegT/DnrJ/EryC1/StrS aminotransferase family protein [Deltaproteobacteria bacterium]
MDFIDLAHQQRRIAEKLNAHIASVLAHGQYVSGPEVRELEAALAGYVGVKHAIGCASGTDALLMALMALDIGPGDAVFTTPFTFTATAEVISLLGASPVFVDIDPLTFNIDPKKLERAVSDLKENRSGRRIPRAVRGQNPEVSSIQTAFTDRRMIDRRVQDRAEAAGNALRPRAVIPVDLFGLAADYDPIEATAARHGLAIIEDAAQSFGGDYKGKKACAFGEIACTSFFPAKPLGCYGDGGMCFTNSDHLDAILRSIRVHGQGEDKYENIRIGINGRLDTLQAAILLAKYSIFQEELDLRQEVARRYSELLADVVATPVIPAGYKSAWAQYSLLARDSAQRAAFTAALKREGIPTAVYYPKPLHLQKAFADAGCREGDFPISEDCAGRIFSLPMHPYLGEKEQRRIACILRGESGK